MQQTADLHFARETIAALRRAGPVALVPTMGALHEGHLALVRAAHERADNVVVSIFVNPKQFGPEEDYATYPRELDDDARLLGAENVELLWAPSPDSVFPPGFATTVSVGALGQVLCGPERPGHFDGVATIVLKLFNQLRPDMALFGEKDWQQLAVIRRMARDLDLTRPAAARIIGVPTAREADGLAMSSRNRYLSPEDRARAAALPQAMFAAAARIEQGRPVADTLRDLQRELLDAGFGKVDYAALAHAEHLTPLDRLGEAPARLFVAARIGTTRLIDNTPVGPGR